MFRLYLGRGLTCLAALLAMHIVQVQIFQILTQVAQWLLVARFAAMGGLLVVLKVDQP